jgi:hypothetical protein
VVVRPEAYREAEYIADNYGACALLGKCVCLRPDMPWLGRGCSSWRPVSAKTFQEMQESYRRG